MQLAMLCQLDVDKKLMSLTRGHGALYVHKPIPIPSPEQIKNKKISLNNLQSAVHMTSPVQVSLMKYYPMQNLNIFRYVSRLGLGGSEGEKHRKIFKELVGVLIKGQ